MVILLKRAVRFAVWKGWKRVEGEATLKASVVRTRRAGMESEARHLAGPCISYCVNFSSSQRSVYFFHHNLRSELLSP